MPARVHLRVTLRHGEAPPDGLVPDPFEWQDALTAPPPRPVPPGERRYCIAGEDLTDPELRVEDVLLVQVRAVDGARVIDAEALIAVSERTLARAITAESETVGEVVRHAEASSEDTINRQEAGAEAMRAHGGAAGAVAAAVTPVVRAERAVVRGALGAVRAVTRGVVRFPDRVRDRWKDASAFLATPEGRTRFRYGLTHPHELHARQKAVTMFLALTALVAALLVAHVGVTLAFPEAASPWRTVLLLFAYGVVTSLGLPLPIEPLLFPAALDVGKPPVIAVTATAKVVAAYLVFFIGDEVNQRMQAKSESSPRFATWLRRSEWFAQRFGILAMAVFIATPGLPDVIALYVFGSLGMRLRSYLLGVALGGVVLYSALLYGVGAALGM